MVSSKTKHDTSYSLISGQEVDGTETKASVSDFLPPKAVLAPLYGFGAAALALLFFAPGLTSLSTLQWFGTWWLACFASTTLLCMYIFSFGRHESPHDRYEGNTIYVRQPKNGGWETMDFSTAGVNSVFCGHFVCLVSALVVPLELNATSFCSDEDGFGVQGYLNQEMNHSALHTVFNKVAQEMGVAPTYTLQKLFTFVLIDVFPVQVWYAFVGVLESGFIIYVHFFGQSRWLYERVFVTPYWVAAYHLQEEAEHHWSSMLDVMHTVGFGYRLVTWLLSVPLLFFLMLVYPILAGLLYSPRRLFLEGAIFRDTLEFVAWMPFFLFATNACNFLHLVCHLTPSTKAYKAQLEENVIPGRKPFRTIFGQYEDMFRVAQVHDCSAGNALVPAPQDGDMDEMRDLVKEFLNVSAAHEQLTQAGVPEEDLEKVFSTRKSLVAMKRVSLRVSRKGSNVSLNITDSGAEEAGLPRFTMEEVRGKGYLVVNGNVVDVSSYKDHPGGQTPFKKFGGRDVSAQFHAIHVGPAASTASTKMAELRVGLLAK